MDALKIFHILVLETLAKMGVHVRKKMESSLAVVLLALLVTDAKKIQMGAKAQIIVVRLKTNVENGMEIVIRIRFAKQV